MCYNFFMDKKALFFYITLFIFTLAMTATVATFVDFDLWARLIAGMGFVEGGHVLKTDFLSYTPVHTWWDHEWGSGVIFYLVFKYFGSYSFMILQAILLFGIFFISSKVIKLRGCDNPYNILFYFFTLMSIIFTINAPVRCQMFSFLLFALFIYLLERVRQGNNKLLYIIPFIIIFWNNIHGGVVSGIGLLVMYALGEFLNKKPFKKYLLTCLASCFALIINPWGAEYIKFLLMANTMSRPDIVEWHGLFSKIQISKHIYFKVFMLFSLIVEGCYLSKNFKSLKDWYEKADKVKYILLLVTLYLAISRVKFISFFAIAVLCFVYEDFYKLIKNYSFPKWKNKLIYGLILTISLFTFATRDFSIPLGAEYYPIKEVEFIKINNLEGKILCNFGVGSFVSYKLYPHNLIYMDGRYEEVYDSYMLPLLRQFFNGGTNGDYILEVFTPDVILVEKKYNVFKILKNSKDWKKVYEGRFFAVFLPAEKSNVDFIQPSNDEKYYKENLFNTDIKF